MDASIAPSTTQGSKPTAATNGNVIKRYTTHAPPQNNPTNHPLPSASNPN